MTDKRQSLDTNDAAQQLSANEQAEFFGNAGKPPEEKPKKKPGPKTDDPVKARGVGLKISEWEYLQAKADEWGYTLHELSLYMMRNWIERFKRGEKPGVKTVTKLDPTK